MRQILDVGDSVSETWIGSGSNGGILLSGSLGRGDWWAVEVQTPDGDWINMAARSEGRGYAFYSDGLNLTALPAGLLYRLNSGLGAGTGAKAWITAEIEL